MWFQKNKWKIITAVIVVAVLVTAFYYGGNAPGSKGWDIEGNTTLSTEDVTTPTPVPTYEPEQTPTPSPDVNKDSDNSIEPTPDVTESPEETEKPLETVSPQPSDTPESTPEPSATPEPTNAPQPSETPVPTGEPVPETPQPTMEIDPETGLDKYLTAPVPEGKPLPVEPEDVVIGSTAYTCTLSISCSTILSNMELCDREKAELVPEDGWILTPTVVTFYEGESVFNVLQRVCKQLGIHMEFEYTPIYNSAYIEGIHNLYEFDVGELSGWMYKVNEWFPNYGCSRYQLRSGDVISWVYTCDLGQDVGGGYAVGNK